MVVVEGGAVAVVVVEGGGVELLLLLSPLAHLDTAGRKGARLRHQTSQPATQYLYSLPMLSNPRARVSELAKVSQ